MTRKENRILYKRAFICAALAGLLVFPISYAVANASLLLAVILIVGHLSALLGSLYFVMKTSD